jgi:hypothetical protein
MTTIADGRWRGGAGTPSFSESSLDVKRSMGIVATPAALGTAR